MRPLHSMEKALNDFGMSILLKRRRAVARLSQWYSYCLVINANIMSPISVFSVIRFYQFYWFFSSDAVNCYFLFRHSHYNAKCFHLKPSTTNNLFSFHTIIQIWCIYTIANSVSLGSARRLDVRFRFTQPLSVEVLFTIAKMQHW